MATTTIHHSGTARMDNPPGPGIRGSRDKYVAILEDVHVQTPLDLSQKGHNFRVKNVRIDSCREVSSYYQIQYEIEIEQVGTHTKGEFE